MPASAAPDLAASRAPSLAVADLVVQRREGPGPARLILDHVSLAVAPGTVVGIAGPSGAGKTTLLHVIAGLLRPDGGSVHWDGGELGALSEAARDRWRRDNVGLVFQDFQLLPELSVIENILLPIRFDHWGTPRAKRDGAALLAARVGLDQRTARAGSLSRGEQQRLAIARALMRRPRLILADEPTASLDAENGARIGDLLIECARENEASLLLVSHDEALLARAAQRYRLADGKLLGERTR
ncbi:MAG: ABC transporter ATP-binding protein [Alphaproteobacteria bacterium]|nr:ABC transporter ATP-binding protein [Alphaproteobacteria bacterium]MBV8410422.1 ABC transporter ATP-binding protein [Alphaproteobacteria bacterium]